MMMATSVLTSALVAVASAGLFAQLAAQRIDLDDFRTLHAAKKVLVVDVRDAQSYANGHIPGAINIPLGQEEQPATVQRLKSEKRPIVTYCA